MAEQEIYIDTPNPNSQNITIWTFRNMHIEVDDMDARYLIMKVAVVRYICMYARSIVETMLPSKHVSS